jgi:hypothetical protein
MKTDKIRNIIVISDTHIGCKHALMSPKGFQLDEGTKVFPSSRQTQIWNAWREFWEEWVPKATHKEPFIVVHNGDVMDGKHHGATSQWTTNLKDQRAHAEEILSEVAERAQGRYYQIRGTECHVGQSAEDEEGFAKAIGAIKDSNGLSARWELMKKIGPYLIHFSHHIGTTSSAAHETSAVNAELTGFFTSAGRSGTKPPDIVVRSHRHMCSEIRLPSDNGYKVSFVTAAWQGKTPFVYRIPGGRTGITRVGGSLIRLGDEELHTRHFIRTLNTVEAE